MPMLVHVVYPISLPAFLLAFRIALRTRRALLTSITDRIGIRPAGARRTLCFTPVAHGAVKGKHRFAHPTRHTTTVSTIAAPLKFPIGLAHMALYM